MEEMSNNPIIAYTWKINLKTLVNKTAGYSKNGNNFPVGYINRLTSLVITFSSKMKFNKNY